MKLKNFFDGISKGKGRTYSLSKVKVRPLIPEIKPEHRMFNFDNSEHNQSILEEAKLESVAHQSKLVKLRIKGYKNIGYQLPDFNLYIDGRMIDFSFVRDGHDISDWDPFLIGDGSGRLLAIIYDLSERDCSIEIPAILAFTPDEKITRPNKWFIYVDFPKYFELKEELRNINAY
jgi:hypothetical protein